MIQNKIYFWNISKEKDLIKKEWKMFSCSILYIHLLPFVRVETEENKLRIILEKKDIRLANQIKRLVKQYSKYLDISSVMIIEEEIIIEINIAIIWGFDENEKSKSIFHNSFNEELTDKINKYFKYEFNFDSYGIDYFECDELIAPSVNLFNKKNYSTQFSCDGDDNPILNPKIHYFGIDEVRINRCDSYISFLFECKEKLEYIKIKNIFKETYEKLISNGLEKDVLLFKYDDTMEFCHKQLYKIVIRSKTTNRLIWNRILFEFASLIPKRKEE